MSSGEGDTWALLATDTEYEMEVDGVGYSASIEVSCRRTALPGLIVPERMEDAY